MRKGLILAGASRLVWVPAVAGPAALVLVLAQFDRLTPAVSWNSDAAAPALLAESLATSGTGEPTVLGDISSFSTLLFFRATHALPNHRAVWEAAPYVLALAGVALLAWVSFRLAGVWAAAMTSALGLAVSTDVLFTQIAPAFHGTTWFSVAVLLAFLIALAGEHIRGRAATIAAVAGVGVVVGLNLASDPLLAVVGVVPFCFAAVAIFRLHPGQGTRRLLRLGGAVVSTAAASAIVTVAAMSVADLSTNRSFSGDGYVTFTSPHDMAVQAGQVWRNLLALTGAADGGALPDAWYRWPAAIAVLGTLVVVPWIAVRTLRRSAALPAPEGAFWLFWSAATVLLVVAYVVSGIPNPETGITNDRYLVPLMLMVASALPIAGSRPGAGRALAAVGAACIAALGLADIAGADLADRREVLPHARFAPQIERWLTDRSVTHGFSDYFDSLSLTYNTNLTVRAVQACDTGEWLCVSPINARRSWYTPRPSGASFLLINPVFGTGREVAAALPGADLGRPQERRSFGPIEVLIYDHDIARCLGGEWGECPSGLRATLP